MLFANTEVGSKERLNDSEIVEAYVPVIERNRAHYTRGASNKAKRRFEERYSLADEYRKQATEIILEEGIEEAIPYLERALEGYISVIFWRKSDEPTLDSEFYLKLAQTQTTLASNLVLGKHEEGDRKRDLFKFAENSCNLALEQLSTSGDEVTDPSNEYMQAMIYSQRANVYSALGEHIKAQEDQERVGDIISIATIDEELREIMPDTPQQETPAAFLIRAVQQEESAIEAAA